MNEVSKPLDWPVNMRESYLDKVLLSFENFIQNPSMENKEFLFSLITINDLNEFNQSGICRYTEYEVAILNTIYDYAILTQCDQAKLFVYEFLIDTILIKKTSEMIMGKSFEETFFDSPYLGLSVPLKIFYIAYVYFRVEKNKTFSQQLIATIKAFRKTNCDESTLTKYIGGANQLFYDLSYNINSKKLSILNFNRSEIKSIYSTLINLWNLYKINPNIRPLRGVFIISIANWVLKSRNNYNKTYIYKCIPNSAAKYTFANKQIWMHDIKKLNDKREGVTFDNILYSKSWLRYDWAKKITIEKNIERYVCSFSKIKPTKKMLNKYGHNIYGYKNDRIGNLISPISLYNNIPMFGLVMAYDILYDEAKCKDEINYISEIVDSINITDEEKIDLMNGIISYWNLSVKDKKWSYEQERRYEIRIFDKYNYFDTIIEDNFLKVKSSIYLLPDFINRGNVMFDLIKTERVNKLKCLSTRDYCFCEECLNSDFDFESFEKCSVCGSTEINVQKV